jgi:hypothetical protein
LERVKHRHVEKHVAISGSEKAAGRRAKGLFGIGGARKEEKRTDALLMKDRTDAINPAALAA